MKVNLPNAYKPNNTEEYMNPMQLQYFKNKLTAMRMKIIHDDNHDVISLGNKTSDVLENSTNEVSVYLDISSKQKKTDLLHEIDDAFARIKNGSYGYCEILGEEIGIKRLEIKPVTKYCIEAQQELDDKS